MKSFQQPEYADEKKYHQTLAELDSSPPIVFPGEIERLKKGIAEAGEGRRFILQGGDCVERFIDCTEQSITNKIKILLQMSVILTYATRRPVLRIGRMAGQFFKPRSVPTEIVDAVEMPVYRGDGINGIESVPEVRAPDPRRMRTSYFSAAATLNYIRAMIAGGFADLHNPYNWNLHAIEQTAKWIEYRDIVEHIIDAVSFMESFGGLRDETIGNIDFYTSHEGLNLCYEEALTRKVPNQDSYYNSGAHMLWIGERTRQLDGGHVEYFRGIANPVGIKIGSSISDADLLRLVEILNPDNEPGKITLITRLGKDDVVSKLPALVNAIGDSEYHVTWSCDPMHGNTVNIPDGVKTRHFDDILLELTRTFQVHQKSGSYLSGVHFELTGENVTECTGGALDLTEGDLNRNYQSYCDPRLNYDQSMELSFLISRYLKQK